MSAIRQGTPAWLEARRSLITATDIPVLIGLSPYKCEADLADEKLTGIQQESTLRMRLGLAVEPLIGEEYTRVTGRRLRKVHGLATHPSIEWAAASPDFRVVGERRLVEAKHTSSRSRFADGLPQDIQAQAVWQAAVVGVDAVDVAVLLPDELVIFEVEHDPAVWDDLVAVAEDFRARLAAGGPFSRDSAYIKRQFPRDDGSEMVADAELTEAVLAYRAVVSQRKEMEEAEERIKTAIMGRMGPATRLTGPGFSVTWKQTKDIVTIDWKSIADGLLRQLPETERTALVGIGTNVKPGFRPFKATFEKE